MIKQEWKNILKNHWIQIVLVALILIPSIYTVVFLGSMWDPYGNSGDLPVAVVNKDKAVEYNDKKLDVGDQLVKKLKDNDSLDFHFVNSKEAKEMFETVTKKLLNKYGLKTLAKGEENYIDIYEGNSFKRDFSYHQGITWTWLLGLYYNCLKRFATESRTGKKKYNEQLEEFIQSVTETFSKEINERGCIGSIAEIYDSKRPFEPKGAVAQAWSVAEVFRIITRS